MKAEVKLDLADYEELKRNADIFGEAYRQIEELMMQEPYQVVVNFSEGYDWDSRKIPCITASRMDADEVMQNAMTLSEQRHQKAEELQTRVNKVKKGWWPWV